MLFIAAKLQRKKYTRMLDKIRLIEQNKELYKYNFIGLFGVAVNKGIQRKHAFFCSQFVAMVVNEGGLQMFNISPSLVQPHHFSQLPCLEPVFEGDLQNLFGSDERSARTAAYPYEYVEKFSVPFTRLNKKPIYHESTSICREGLSFLYPNCII